MKADDIILNSYDEFLPYGDHIEYYKNDKVVYIIRLANEKEIKDYFNEERSMQKQKNDFEQESYYHELPD